MNDDGASAIARRGKTDVGKLCVASVTPRQLRLSQGEWLMFCSIWTEDNPKAWQVWYDPETDEGQLWPQIVTKEDVIPRRFEP